MVLRSGLFVFMLCLAFVSKAQQDSILLKPVSVFGVAEKKYLVGSRLEQLDSAIKATQVSSHLADALAFQFPVYFRNYGNGMISGISMRGTAPQHTAVLWNGININSYSLGQVDFSILPSVAFTDVSVHSGGGSTRFGSGAFGGSVLLSSSVTENAPVLLVQQEVGSFGRMFSSVKGSFKRKKISASTTLYRQAADNDFHIERLNIKQQHAAFQQQGVMQNLAYNLNRNDARINVSYWYHEADREVQPALGRFNSTDEQQDQNHRASISYEQNNAYGLMRVGAGVVDDVIVYNKQKSEIFRTIAFIDHQYSFGNNWNVQFNANWNHIIGKIDQYNGEPEEDRVDVAASLQKEFCFGNVSLNLRQPFISKVNAPFLPYIGTSIPLYKTLVHELTFLANASKNFRAPTFNERYWEALERKDLKPEVSYAAEAGLQWRYRNLNIGAQSFYQIVDEWIQWVPSGNTVRPQNIKQVHARGVELNTESKWKINTLALRVNAAYQFTKSTTEKAEGGEAITIGKQLIYTPLHTASGAMVATLKGWSLQGMMQYAGKRFTESLNSSVYTLDPYLLMDVAVSKSFTLSTHTINAFVTVKNIMNTDYQQYANHAMPGRNFSIRITYQLNQPTK